MSHHDTREEDPEWLADNPWYKPIADAIAQERLSGQPMWFGFPDRWFDKAHYRCKNDHVSTAILKSEERGDLCLECLANVRLTFPEDSDGPCVYPGPPSLSPRQTVR